MIDLHVHSTASDGFYSPKELLKMALDIKLEAMALTDHDAIAGIRELKKEAKGKNIEIINGAELSAFYPDVDIEILALDIPEKYMYAFEDYQDQEFERRKKVTELRLSLVQKLGYDITYQEVAYDEKGNLRTQVRRPHFVDVLLKKGYIQSTEEAYKKIFTKRFSKYVNNKPRGIKDVISFIKDNGAKAVLAHPIHTKKEDKELYNLVNELKEYGLDGVEVFHSSHPFENRKKYIELICDLGMISAGGSDFHGGTAHPDNMLGFGRNNNLNMPYMVLEELLNYKEGKAINKAYYTELYKHI